MSDRRYQAYLVAIGGTAARYVAARRAWESAEADLLAGETSVPPSPLLDLLRQRRDEARREMSVAYAGLAASVDRLEALRVELGFGQG